MAVLPTQGSDSPVTSSLCAIALWIALSGPAFAASTDVYRCTSADGRIEFRQGPCTGSAGESPLTLEDRPTGWVPPAPPKTRSEDKAKTRQEADRSGAAAKQVKKDERACWEKRKRLEEVEARLRHGYKAKQGMDLKRKQEYYEDYLHQFCR